MKLYQVIRLEKKLSEELSELNNRFITNNCINIDEVRDYEPNIILEEIKAKKDTLVRIRFLIQRYNLNIGELVLQNNEYNDMIKLLKSTPTSMNNDKINSFLRIELDKLIKEYQDKIERNQESIDYYNFITDVEI